MWPRWRDRHTGQTDQSAQKQTRTHTAAEGQQEVGGERTAFSTNGAGANGHVQKKKKESHPKLTPCTKTDAKWITDLTVKCKIIKLLGKKQEEIFGIQHLSGEFLDWTPTE